MHSIQANPKPEKMNTTTVGSRWKIGNWFFDQDFREPQERRVLLLAFAMLVGTGISLYLNGYHGGFHAYQSWSGNFHPVFWASVTVLGDERILLALALPFFRRYPQVFWSILISAILAGLLCRGLKLMTEMPRPVMVLLPDALTVIGPRRTSSSLPSGHSAAIFAFVGVWIAYLSRSRMLPIICLAAFAASSRVAVGAHWPADVILGGALGLLSSWSGIRLANHLKWHYGTGYWRICLGVVVLATCTLPFDGQGYEQSIYFRIVVCAIGLFFAISLYRDHLPWRSGARVNPPVAAAL